MPAKDILEWAKQIRSIADKGLLYATDNFDRERYSELLHISAAIMSDVTTLPVDAIQSFYNDCKDYPTPKVDVRAIVINSENKILMVQEKAVQCWSLPGGWADIGSTPSEVAEKEIKEETGIIAKATHLMAVYDKRKHLHPPQPYYVYKMIFHCIMENEQQQLTPAFDVLDAAWFHVHALPPLSKDRILLSQIEEVFNNIQYNHFQTLFD